LFPDLVFDIDFKINLLWKWLKPSLKIWTNISRFLIECRIFWNHF
jgi:hypothetical protein